MSAKIFLLEYDPERRTINICNYPYIDGYSAGSDISPEKDRVVFELLADKLNKIIIQASKPERERGMRDA